MFATSPYSRAKRRGIVLVLVLGMLGLLALIGVTFATFANQAQINSRSFALAANFPDASEVMDFALSQLIDDTSNPASVIRGHSLKRDMYGNDALNNGAILNGGPGGAPLAVTGITLITSGTYAGMIQLTTNIPSNNSSAGAQFYGFDFTRWILRFPTQQVSPGSPATSGVTYVNRSHEILVDDPTGFTIGSASSFRLFYIAVPNYDIVQFLKPSVTIPQLPPFDSPLTVIPTSPAPFVQAPMISGFTSPETSIAYLPWSSALTTIPTSTGTGLPAINAAFTLDGRFLRAFNGPGISGMNAFGLDTALLGNSVATFVVGHPLSEFANFRYNGNLFNNVLTSFNTPAAIGAFTPFYGDPNQIPAAMDEDYDACDLENWFLAIQSADGQVVIPSFHRPGILTINPLNTADNDWTRSINNAGTDVVKQLAATRAMSRILRPRSVDGHNSISFPNLIPNADGTITYDVDNDGDGQSDSVWLDLGYPPQRNATGQLFKPLFAFMVIGLNGRLPLNTAGNLQDQGDNLSATANHTEHLGYSPSEIDIRYALNNAYDPNYSPTTQAALPLTLQGNYTQGDNTITINPTAGTTAFNPILAQTTQLRNLLAGTRPSTSPSIGLVGDTNFVLSNGQRYPLPNGIADSSDGFTVATTTSSPGYVYQLSSPVAGRWGEESFVPGSAGNSVSIGNPMIQSVDANGNTTSLYANAIRAGYSMNQGGTTYDARDDNYNTFDFFSGQAAWPELADLYDLTGSIVLPVERIRRFVTPIDLDGNGRVITFNSHSESASGPGKNSRLQQNGADLWGRVSFFSYFRPAGMPLPTNGPVSATSPLLALTAQRRPRSLERRQPDPEPDVAR